MDFREFADLQVSLPNVEAEQRRSAVFTCRRTPASYSRIACGSKVSEDRNHQLGRVPAYRIHHWNLREARFEQMTQVVHVNRLPVDRINLVESTEAVVVGVDVKSVNEGSSSSTRVPSLLHHPMDFVPESEFASNLRVGIF